LAALIFRSINILPKKNGIKKRIVALGYRPDGAYPPGE
jgi:hypothetical protein